MSRIRKFLLHHVIRSTKLTQAIQRYRSPIFDIFMKFATKLGGLPFYIIFVPALAWLAAPLKSINLLDSEFVFDFSYLLFFLTLFASALKDIFNLPRPTKVWKLKRETDRGFPSSHSMNCTAMWLFTLRRLDLTENTNLLFLATVWIALVAFSRIYNGVHSYPDIIGGIVVGYILGVSFSSQFVLQLQLLRGWTAVVLAVVSVAIFPRPPTISASRCLTLASMMIATTVAKYLSDDSLLAQQLEPMVPDWMREMRLPLVPTRQCSSLRVAIHRSVFGLALLGITFFIARALGCVAMDSINFVLEKCNIDIDGVLRRTVALPTAPYKQQTRAQTKLLNDEKHKTRHRVFSAFYVMLFVLYIAPTLFNLIDATTVGDCVGGVPRH